ncbi:MAG TPA: T9SS type A sorting domain-containing protein [Panacibacter sp.]|nr:T9SS type A sorting domain-containing protein [Panacibacter sp.]
MKTFYFFPFVAALLITATSFAQAGSLDLSFDTDGKKTTDFQLYYGAGIGATTLQADGKILAAGYIASDLIDFSGHPYTSVILSRYNANGTPDNSFGTGGSVITRAGSMSDVANAITLQQDGKIIVAGSTQVPGGSNILVIRYNINGTIDNTFGVNGKVITDIKTDYDDVALAVKMHKNGTIIIGGYSDRIGDFTGVSVLARYTANGSVDNTFGTNGIILDDWTNSQINALTVQQDSKIVTAGYGDGAFGANAKVSVKRYNINGSPDITFGLNGNALLNIPESFWDEALSVALQPDGKMVICGRSYDQWNYSELYFFVARFNSNGSLDNNFGSGGTVTLTNSLQGQAISAFIQTDGKIVMTTDNYSIYKFNTDGTADNSFGVNGMIHVDIENGSYGAFSAVIQNDNKIIAAGHYNNINNESQYHYGTSGIAITRFTTNGTLDNSFGSLGTVKTDFKTPNASTDYGQSVAIGREGNIIVAGYSYSGAFLNQSLSCYKPDGSPDLIFDSNGKLTINNGGNFQGFSLAVQQDENLLLAGRWHNGSNYDFAVTRYSIYGHPDFNNFGTNGIAHVATGNSDESAYAVAIQTDGKIVLAGTSYNGHDYDIALARFNSNGTVDNSFSFDGVLTKNISNGNDYGYSIAIQPDGKIVVGGYGYGGTNDDFIVLRFLTDGSPDNSFGTNGMVKTSITKTSNDYGKALKIQADGKIILAGYTNNGLNNDYAIVRYNSNGTIDNSFNLTGMVTGSFEGTSNDYCTSAAIQADGKIVIAGYYYKNTTNKNDFAIARYLSNGKPDAAFGAVGKVLTDFGGTDDYANSIAVQQDGKLVVAGTSANDFAVARYNSSGSSIIPGISDVTSAESLKSEQLMQLSVAPNPVSATAVIRFNNSERRNIVIELFDVSGRKVKNIFNGITDKGAQTIRFNRDGLKGGIYFLHLNTGNRNEIKKVLIE